MLVFACATAPYATVALAAHEAGHAIAAIAQGVGVREAFIGEGEGYVDLAPDPMAESDPDRARRRLSVILVAGAVAQRAFAARYANLRRFDVGASRDDDQFDALWSVAGVRAGSVAWEREGRRAVSEATSIVDRRLADVDCVATGLLLKRTLTGREVGLLAALPYKRDALARLEITT